MCDLKEVFKVKGASAQDIYFMPNSWFAILQLILPSMHLYIYDNIHSEDDILNHLNV